MEFVCKKNKCTLCMACANACPKNAIFVDKDEYNYELIRIDKDKCIDCGVCQRVCEKRVDVERNSAHNGYAAQAIDRAALMKSASGGAFQMLAEYILENGGVCYGCNAILTENGMLAHHLRVDNIADLPKILNTKYIPSIVGNVFSLAREDLISGKTVLFSGTPCQIQGMKAFLAKDYENLLTVDVICHGVGSTQIFNDYLSAQEQILGIKITDYSFRDKSVSWGTNFCYQYYTSNDPKQKIKTKHLPREVSSYTTHYLRGDIARENCYSCKLANTERVSDFTFGDFWGIEAEHPALMMRVKPAISLRRGVSCILANTEKATRFVSILKERMILHEVPIASIVSHNANLSHPTERSSIRAELLKNYKENGYVAVEQAFSSSISKRGTRYKVKNLIKACIPDRVRIWLYNHKKLRKFISR